MHCAVTALVLTVAYVALLLVREPVAVEVSMFYLAAVCILIGGHRLGRMGGGHGS